MDLELSRQSSENSSNIRFRENPSNMSWVIPCGRTDSRTGMTVAFRGFAKTPETCSMGFVGLFIIHWYLHTILPPPRSSSRSQLKWQPNVICGNKMPTRCDRGFYCRSYCLLNMIRTPLCPSSGAQEYYTVVVACGISCCGFSSCWSGVELRVKCPVCRMLQHPANRTHNPQLHTRPATWKPQHEIPQAATTV